MKTIDRDEVIQRIVGALQDCDGEVLEELHNQIMAEPVTYRRDLAYEGGAFDLQE